MTRSELIEQFAKDAGISRQRAAYVVDAFFDGVADGLEKGERVEIRNFGNFSVRPYKSYVGRNPRTGETVKVAAKRLPYFRPSNTLRDQLNE